MNLNFVKTRLKKSIILLYIVILDLYSFDWYTPLQCPDGKDPQVIKNTVKGFSDLTKLKEMDQGKTGTCYAHSALQLLQYNSEKKGPLSITQAIVEGLDPRRETCNGGTVSSILYNLRKERPLLRPRDDIEDILFYEDSNSLCLKLGVSTQLESFSKINSLNKELFIKRNRNNELVGGLYGPEGLFKPDYNFNIFDERLKFDTQDSGIEKIEILLEEPKPIALNVGDHAVTVMGVANVCCPTNINCKKRILIRNSWGEIGSGWFDVDSLIESSKNENLRLTYTRECFNANKGGENIKNLPNCEFDYIYGDAPIISLISANDKKAVINAVKYFQSEGIYEEDEMPFLHLAACHASKDMFVDLFSSGVLLIKSFISRDGQTPLQVAISCENNELIPFIISKDTDDINKGHQFSELPLVMVVKKGNFEILKVLMDTKEVNLKSKIEALNVSLEKDNREISNYLLENISEDEWNKVDWSESLNSFASGGNYKILELLSTKKDFLEINHFLLHASMLRCDEKTIDLLIKLGFLKYAQEKYYGKNLIEHAEFRCAEKYELIKFLKSKLDKEGVK